MWGPSPAWERIFSEWPSHDLQNGDGLCFFTKQNDLAGFRVDRVDKEKIYPNNMKGLEIGTPLYRNHDMAFTRILKKSSAHRRIAVEMDFMQEDTVNPPDCQRRRRQSGRNDQGGFV